MKQDVLDTHQKALQINLDDSVSAAFAEMGAGQEVARWFFRMGGASGAIPRATSVTDTTLGDEIYGPCQTGVSRNRLETMLEHEYKRLLVDQLNRRRSDKTVFFAFASTVELGGRARLDEAHGWLGLRFQTRPQAQPSQIVVHFRLLDRKTVQDGEPIGVLGVNLVHGARHLHDNPEALALSLIDNLVSARVEVDFVEFSGLDFATVDNRLVSLKLVEHGLADAAIFDAAGQVIPAAELLRDQSILVQRGSFQPVTNATLDALRCAQAMFKQEPRVEAGSIVTLQELNLERPVDGGAADGREILERADLLGALGQTVLVSSFAGPHNLATYLARLSGRPLGLVLDLPELRDLFDQSPFAGEPDGTPESNGFLFRSNVKVYCYPALQTDGQSLHNAANLRVKPQWRHLYAHFLENGRIAAIRHYDRSCLPIAERDVLKLLRNGDPAWEKLVPPAVVERIKKRRLFGYTDKPRSRRSPKPARGGLIDSIHMAGMPKAA